MVRFNACLEIGICGLLSYFISFCISCNKHEAVLSRFQFSAQRSGKTENDIISASGKCNSVAKGDQNISRRWCQTLPLQFKLELIAWPLFIYEVPHRSLQVILLGHYPSLQTTHALPVTSIFSLRGSQMLGQQQQVLQVLFVGRNTTRPAKASESQKKTKTGRPGRRKGSGGRAVLCCGASVCRVHTPESPCSFVQVGSGQGGGIPAGHLLFPPTGGNWEVDWTVEANPKIVRSPFIFCRQ